MISVPRRLGKSMRRGLKRSVWGWESKELDLNHG
jgi:hypothetical protein